MNKQAVKVASGSLLFIAFVAAIAGAAIRLNRVEEQSAQVPDMVSSIRIITIYLKLVDPANFEKAKELAKDE